VVELVEKVVGYIPFLEHALQDAGPVAYEQELYLAAGTPVVEPPLERDIVSDVSAQVAYVSLVFGFFMN